MSDSLVNLDSAKLRELVLYIAARSTDDPLFGKTKLHKLLWMSDFLHFSMHGRSISGATYIRNHYGPFCAELEDALHTLNDAQALTVEERQIGNFTQKRPVPHRWGDLAKFDALEIKAVEEVLSRARLMSASDLSALSHRHPGWILTPQGEPIGYEFSKFPLLDEDDPPYG